MNPVFYPSSKQATSLPRQQGNEKLAIDHQKGMSALSRRIHTYAVFRSLLITYLFSYLIIFQANAQTNVAYTWKNVAIGGGGFVPGIMYSKAEPNLIYARTDVGGAYRWNATDHTWIPLTDQVSDFNDLGVLSLAADPTDANRVYMAVGLYEADWWGSNGRIYASSDKGTTWTVANLPFKLGGNDPGRGSGEKLQVDPNQNNTLFLGTNANGLWKSTDFGATWNKVTSFPTGKITFVEFDKSTGTTGNPTGTIYVGVFDHLPNTLAPSIYRSTDGGNTWEALRVSPLFSLQNPGMPRNIRLW